MAKTPTSSKKVKISTPKNKETLLPKTVAHEDKPSTPKPSVPKERKPLYEPKHRVQLPPRNKTKIHRWPQITLPPLKLKPWDPEKAAKLPTPPPKPKVEIPPLKTKPWTPPKPPQPPPKVQIQYPPVTPRSKP